jgi:hypothetical protein
MIRALSFVALGLALVRRDEAPRGTAGENSRDTPALATTVGEQARPVGIRHVTVIDVEHNRRLRDQTVVIEGTRIATVGPSDQVRIPDGYGVVEGRGKFVIPGFVDARPFARDASRGPSAAATGDPPASARGGDA